VNAGVHCKNELGHLASIAWEKIRKRDDREQWREAYFTFYQNNSGSAQLLPDTLGETAGTSGLPAKTRHLRVDERVH
jgi:hypothetical protein